MSRPAGLKKFPPLHHLTARALPPRPEDDMQAAFMSIRAMYNAEIHIGLGMLVFETLCDHMRQGDEARLPSIEENRPDDLFGRVAQVALQCADTSFFEQVKHCVLSLGNKKAEEDLGWMTSYIEARLLSEEKIPPAPVASTVADAQNNHDKKTAIPAVVARDACRRLGLPLAPGKRGKKRGGESGKNAD